MGNINVCVRLLDSDSEDQNRGKEKKSKKKRRRNRRIKETKENPFAESPNSPVPLKVLKDLIPLSHRSRITDKYVLSHELGRGEFGVTYLCTDRETHETLACKSISKKKLRTAIDIEDVRREVSIMSSLPDHPNLVRLKGTYEDDEAVHIVMELCEGGELFDRIVARGHYSERAAANVVRTIVEVVRMCHDHGVMHRDLKPENFLFANKKENAALKAIDFGLSVFFQPGERFSEIVGSPYYMAPEVLKRNYGPEVDIWSAGVILYILLCGVPPFWDETEQGVAQAIIRGVIDFRRDPWPLVSESAKSLVRKMLQSDPRKRLTAQQVLEHPWLQNAKKASNVPLGDIVRSRLKQFSAMNRFKKKAMRVIAEHLSAEEVEVIRDMFKLMDTDRNGKITYEELKTGLQKVGSQLAEPEIKMLMEAITPCSRKASVEKRGGSSRIRESMGNPIRDDFRNHSPAVNWDKPPIFDKFSEEADVNGSGTLDYGEFVAVTLHLQRMENEVHFQKAFLFFDKDGSGYIEMDELQAALMDESGEIEVELLNDIIREVDTDKDGRVSYEEFVKMMKTGTDWRKASRNYSRERFKSLSINLMKDGSLYLDGQVFVFEE
ncbi:hypothetical protein GIB67_004708 [Kingdonia uniflora]|uniref:non-specific serine/threonine protein kinase n=1 Tax=Kingdonia uniflora TaxID=39325 RepID=A0A7J7P5W4_9MAGN|nr:hypothetical protein GIB67_004708 [Kingdonia uniflora]